MVFGDGPLGGNQMRLWASPQPPITPLLLPHIHTKKRSCEHTAGCSCLQRGFRRTPTLAAGDLRLRSLHKCEKIDFWCLSHPVCATLLWQPKLTDPDGQPENKVKFVLKQKISVCALLVGLIFQFLTSDDSYLWWLLPWVFLWFFNF